MAFYFFSFELSYPIDPRSPFLDEAPVGCRPALYASERKPKWSCERRIGFFGAHEILWGDPLARLAAGGGLGALSDDFVVHLGLCEQRHLVS